VSVATPPAAHASAPASDACPMCGAPLRGEQDWCLSCGAAARTRLAATPNWRAPIALLAVLAALALGVLVAALVELAGSSTSSPRRPAAGLTSPQAGAASQGVPGSAASPARSPTATTPATTSPATTNPAATTPAPLQSTGAPAKTPPAPRATTPGAGATGGAAGGAAATGTTGATAPAHK
jgi:hypothetical protein